MTLKMLFTGLLLSSGLVISAQDTAPENWFNLDPSSGVPGVATERTYQELLQNKPAKPVIVAVLDSGVDDQHEDLKDVMWVNEDEIPGNGIDDDKNGYIDDIHGWSFLGNKNGTNVVYDNLEVVRQYKKLKAEFADTDPGKLSKKDKARYDQYKEWEKDIKNEQEKNQQNALLYGGISQAVSSLQKKINKEVITIQDLENFQSSEDMLNRAAQVMITLMSEGQTFESIVDELQEAFDHFYSKVNYHYNVDYDSRSIVGDNPDNLQERYYGNNDVKGPDADHGTHVAGTIGANRHNDIGMMGVADNVRIMSVRTVPDGDERDKDVANAIRYAVDNGASVINMSFGKGQSPNKDLVDEAVKYALKNDVLIVHAAGNDANENSSSNNYPNDQYLGKKKTAKNWIEVGAANWVGGEELPAEFSNYSPKYVDIFAPGVDIYSTTPDNTYKNHQGTSMAAPVVAGVAALIRSRFPELTAVQVKEILLASTTPVTQKVYIPGTEDLVSMKDLCVSGGVVNAYKAVQLAQQTKGKKKMPKGAASGSGSSGKNKAAPRA